LLNTPFAIAALGNRQSITDQYKVLVLSHVPYIAVALLGVLEERRRNALCGDSVRP